MAWTLKGAAQRYALPWHARLLIWQFARREVLGRYRGSVLGLGWSLMTPLLMLAVYTLVFVGVFKARWPGAETGGGVEFALQIFAGLMVFNWFAEMANRAPRLILEQPNLVKKVVFPLEVLPWVTLLAALFHCLLNVAVLLLATWVVRGSLPVTVLALPLVLAVLVPFVLGLSWLMAALGVFVRDVGQIMGLLVSLFMFLSPVFYSLSSLSVRWQQWMRWNPLTPVIEGVRAVVLQGVWPDWLWLGGAALGFVLFAWAAAAFFETTRPGFADAV